MSRDEAKEIKLTIMSFIAAGELSPKKMLKELRSMYPKASKSDFTRGAFALMLENAESDPDKSRAAHSVALDMRNSGSEDPEKEKSASSDKKIKKKAGKSEKSAEEESRAEA